MMSQKNRLVKDKDFENVFKKGFSKNNAYFGLKYMRNQEKVSRFGVVVSSKVSKKAVVRNKIKRQLREILRLEIDNYKTGYDIAVIVRSKSLELSYQELDQKIKQLLSLAGLFHEKK